MAELVTAISWMKLNKAADEAGLVVELMQSVPDELLALFI